MKITIRRFKSIEVAELDLDRINVLVGGNNAGKSSIIQAIQFAVSCAQTAQASTYQRFKRTTDILQAVLSPESLFYSPIRDVYALGYDNVSLGEDKAKAIEVTFEDDQLGQVSMSIRRGRGRNLSLEMHGQQLGERMQALDEPFSMYVPGLSGIPFQEEFIAFGAVRRAAARGDSNRIFRNVLLQLHNRQDRWSAFLDTLRTVFPHISIKVSCELDNTASVDISVSFDGQVRRLPIDAMGTGILQAIQISAYIHLFQPKLLLLDEPDAHLHPNNEIALANLLVELTEQMDTKIIMATHSRTLITVLKDKGKFFRIIGGQITVDQTFDHYATLFNLGALDDFDTLILGQYQWVILSEDTSNKARKALQLILEASGLPTDRYKIYPYAGTDHISEAIFAAKFMCGLHPSIRVLIHIDRDGRTEEERDALINSISDENTNIYAYVTQYNDIEAMFCMHDHVQAILQTYPISNEQYQNALDNSLEELKEESISKIITNRCKYRRIHNNQGEVAQIARIDYEDDPLHYVYGKKLRGLLAGKLQEICRRNVNLFTNSEHLADTYITSLVTEDLPT